MKQRAVTRIFRILRRLTFGLLVFGLLYVLSIGPASAWVANTVSGRSLSELNPSLYDQRLSRFYRFYSPLLYFRMWLRFRVSGEAEAVFAYYESIFHRPRRLADGRKVFTSWDPATAKSQAAAETHLKELQGIYQSDIPIPAETLVFALPRSGRLLYVLSPENERHSEHALHESTEDSATWFADLLLP